MAVFKKKTLEGILSTFTKTVKDIDAFIASQELRRSVLAEELTELQARQRNVLAERSEAQQAIVTADSVRTKINALLH